MVLSTRVIFLMKDIAIPSELRQIIGSATWQSAQEGCSGARVWRLEGPCGPAWLKADSPGTELARESEILTWVQGRLPAPLILWVGNTDNTQWLLTTEVPGANLSQIQEPELMIRLMAQGLKLLHGLDAVACPFQMSLEMKLAEARNRILADEVDTEDFDCYPGKSPERILEKLLSSQPAPGQLVFTHGDYCPDNIFYDQGEIRGFIDWGRAGLADPYQDLALAVRSLEHQFGPGDWGSELFRQYGIEEPQWDRVRYYILLDELF